jgi:NADH-quinone oxidoreductase subunit D
MDATLEKSQPAEAGTPSAAPKNYEVLRKDSEMEGDLLEVAMGPHHPSTHGVFRMDVVLDGERVVKLKPVFGYLHRNHEKIGEGTSYLASMPYTDRLDYFCSLTNNWAYALAVEKLAGLQVPERAEYIRVITAELTRLQNHASLVGFLLQDMGALGTPLMYAFREREKILDLFEALTGARMMCNYMRFGGCRVDLPVGWLEESKQVVANFPRFIDEYERLISGNEILMARTQGVGVLPSALAINAGITGPMLRAAGVNYDIRKVDHYGIYDRFKFRVPLGDHGDVFDRYMIRILEMRESVGILEQALRDIPPGQIIDPKAKLRGFRPKVGEAYGRIEAPKGELGFYLISDGTPNPYRYRVRPPSFINLTVLEDMCLGQMVADVVIILGSVDIVLGEVDR